MRKEIDARLTRLLTEARSLATTSRRTARLRSLQGATWHEALEAVYASASDAGVAVLDEIAAQARRLAEAPPPERFAWQTDEQYREMVEDERPRHGFVEWVLALTLGWATLPDELPDEVLLAWRDGFLTHPCNAHGEAVASPIPALRCENCWMVLPNALPAGRSAGSFASGFWESCPVCGSDRLGPRNFGHDGQFYPAPKRPPRQPARR